MNINIRSTEKKSFADFFSNKNTPAPEPIRRKMDEENNVERKREVLPEAHAWNNPLVITDSIKNIPQETTAAHIERTFTRNTPITRVNKDSIEGHLREFKDKIREKASDPIDGDLCRDDQISMVNFQKKFSICKKYWEAMMDNFIQVAHDLDRHYNFIELDKEFKDHNLRYKLLQSSNKNSLTDYNGLRDILLHFFLNFCLSFILFRDADRENQKSILAERIKTFLAVLPDKIAEIVAINNAIVRLNREHEEYLKTKDLLVTTIGQTKSDITDLKTALAKTNDVDTKEAIKKNIESHNLTLKSKVLEQKNFDLMIDSTIKLKNENFEKLTETLVEITKPIDFSYWNHTDYCGSLDKDLLESSRMIKANFHYYKRYM